MERICSRKYDRILKKIENRFGIRVVNCMVRVGRFRVIVVFGSVGFNSDMFIIRLSIFGLNLCYFNLF